jgi:hypothetical protein
VRSRDEITIESHDLQADPAHQGLLILQVTLAQPREPRGRRFRTSKLEILDLGGQPQTRRALAPVDYAGGAADFTRGMPAGAEWNVKLFIDASSVSARGYNLDLFYPVVSSQGTVASPRQFPRALPDGRTFAATATPETGCGSRRSRSAIPAWDPALSRTA